MYVTELPAHHPDKVGTRRAVRFGLLDEGEVIEDVEAANFLVNHVASVRNLEGRRELRHRAGVGRRTASRAGVTAAL